MNQTINFAIDLGTTNSLIAKYNAGNVEIFKNPANLKETLPSVVAFRKERIIVGDKARELVEKDPSNVVSLFKRKMGTDESFFIKNLNDTRSPIQLSATVLRELKNFVYSGETVPSVVITIPASFDTIQSNATKKAGYEAGFQEVVLLQEPIAASLAFANKTEEGVNIDGQWLVYDLGGGTFDVALVRFEEGEMRVMDHEGDNFLGGLDFDSLIIEQIIVPFLRSQGDFGDVLKEMKSSDGRYNKLYYVLRYKAEEAKIMLSSAASAEIEFEIEDLDGEEHEFVCPISRESFERCIREKIEGTVEMIRSILERNALHSSEIEQIILIGGSTYIPLIKKMIAEELQITVNQSVDPTNAVVVGAAHFAGGKNRKIEADALPPTAKPSNAAPNVFLKTAYQKATHDREEYFMAEVTGMTIGLFYRIIRQDGGYYSGQKALPSRIAEVLPLVPNMLNTFSIKMTDANGNVVSCNVEHIDIVQGKFTLYGQPLPNDICVEIDDFQNNTTKLEVVFEKNALLPLKKTLMRTVSKTINKGSKDNLIINVLEGSRYSNPSVCLPLGIIEFKGEDLTMNLVKGSDVEIVLEVSESRDLKIQAVLLMTDQEMTDIFNPSVRAVNLGKLETEVTELLSYARRELVNLEREELFKEAAKTQKCIHDLEEIKSQLRQTNDKDSTDLRFQLEERKRKLAQLLDSLIKDRNAESIKNDYFEAKHFCEVSLERGTPLHKERYERAIANERTFLASNNGNLIKSKEKELYQLAWTINQNDPVFIINLFHYYQFLDDYLDERKAKHYISLGEKALERQNYQELKSILYQLDALRPDEKRAEEKIKGTGLG